MSGASSATRPNRRMTSAPKAAGLSRRSRPSVAERRVGPVATASLILHPRIEQCVAEVDEQVYRQDDEGEDHQPRLDHHVIALRDRADQQLAEAGAVEHRLREYGTAQD